MKKNLKSVISVVIVSVMLIGIAAVGFGAASAADSTVYNEGAYYYTVSSGEAKITDVLEISGDVTLPSALGGYPVTGIGESAFEGCVNLGNVVIPASVETIGIGAFAGCESLEGFAVDSENPNFASDEWGILYNKEKNKIVSYPAGSKRTVYAIPADIEEIERSAFKGAKYLEDITWLNPEMEFGLSVFSDCTSLYRVTVPEGVTYLKDWMFNACFSLKEVNLPESLETIGSGVFHWCTGLEHVELPSGLKLIYNNAFNECYSLKSITLPDGLEHIAPTVFQKCYSLESIDFPSSVNYIGGTNFYQNYSLKKISFPEGIKSIDDDILRYCFTLENVTLPESTERILAGAFEDCRILKTLSLPQKVNSITGEAFVNCIAFEGVSVDENNAYFSAGSDGVLFNKDRTKLVYYPANKNQTVYAVPDTVMTIGAYAFTDAQNTAALIIPDSVTEIEADAFSGLNIRDLYFEGTEEEWNAFSVGSVTAQLHLNYKGTDHVHDYFQEFITEPDCAGNGKKSFVCSCGENSEIDYHYAASRMLCLGAGYEWKGLSDSDCSQKGKTSLCCTECGKAFATIDLPKDEHSLDITVSETSGSVEYNCKECEYIYSETIPADKKYIHYNNVNSERISFYSVGDKIAAQQKPTKEGVSFLGWADESGEIIELSVMPNKNLILSASFGTVLESGECDVTVTYGEDCFSEKVSLVVKDLGTGQASGSQSSTGNINYHEIKEDGKTARPVGFYSIKMINSNGDVAQPNSGKYVTVTMKIPDGYTDRTEFKLYHWYSEGGYEIISTDGTERKITRNGDYLTFEVYSFSNFELFAIFDGEAEISKLPKTSYHYKSGDIDLDGIELRIPNGDGTYETVSDTAKMTVSGFDSSKIGEQTVTVEYEGASAEFKVNVSYAWWQWIIRILLLGFLWY